MGESWQLQEGKTAGRRRLALLLVPLRPQSSADTISGKIRDHSTIQSSKTTEFSDFGDSSVLEVLRKRAKTCSPSRSNRTNSSPGAAPQLECAVEVESG